MDLLKIMGGAFIMMGSFIPFSINAGFGWIVLIAGGIVCLMGLVQNHEQHQGKHKHSTRN